MDADKTAVTAPPAQRTRARRRFSDELALLQLIVVAMIAGTLARIVSTRRASYFASVARARGETADRVVEPDPSWVLPVWSEPDPEPELTAHLDAAA